ncbi:MAG: DUF308 domain-containing protein [Pseudomonadota bacterium]
MTNRVLWFIVGLLSIIGGTFALANPIAATLAATAIAAWMFIIVGVLQIIGGFRQGGVGAKIWTVLLGLLGIFVGVSILQHPLAGMVALTTVVAVTFLVAGLFKVVLSFSLEERRFFWVFLLSGVVSVGLAVMIFSNFPQSAAVMLGILLGIDLISNGVVIVALGLSTPDQAAEGTA